MEQRITHMGVGELAKVAKALVELEILGTLNNEGPSTVGGDVILATIDARDGITWHNRI
jgi:hypothetical protein